MLTRGRLQKLIRRRLIAMPSGSVSETYPMAAEIIVQPMAAEIEEQFVRRIDELISRHRQTAIPAALQVEFEIYPRLYEEVAALNNEIVDYLQANMIVPSGRLINKILQLQRLGQRYREKVNKVASYLGKPVPEMTELKPIPSMILFAGRWTLRGLRARRVM